MGAITVRRAVAGKMGVGVFVLGIAAFLVSFFDPNFFPLAWFSLGVGALAAVLLSLRNRRLSHPTISHLAKDPEEDKPIHPR